MPYESIDDLPEEQTRQYSRSQKEKFKHEFNKAVENGEDEQSAFAKAHSAAKNEGDGS